MFKFKSNRWFGTYENYEIKMIMLFRFVALSCTSIFFLLENLSGNLIRNIFTASCIFISSSIFSFFYLKSLENIKMLRRLVFLETFGNSMILIPTGGLASPYLWYFINTIFIAAFYLGWKECACNIIIYASVSIINMHLYWNFNASLRHGLEKQPEIVLSIVIVSLTIFIMFRFINIQKREKQKLEKANRKADESLNEIMAMYQAIEVFSHKNSRKEIIDIILDYIVRITRTKYAFLKETNESSIHVKDNTQSGEFLSQSGKILNRLEKLNIHMRNTKKPMEINIDEKRYSIISLNSTNNHYGVIGVDITELDGDIIDFQNINQLIFIEKLSSMAFEKRELERVNERLIVATERNRIANELHDSVLQRLFGMSCGIYGMMKNIEHLSYEESIKELNNIRVETNDVMKDLRKTIYGMSFNKDGECTFLKDIQKYIEKIVLIMDVNIELDIKGKVDLLNIREKKAFYRIICESIGNAIRHGNAKEIKVCLLAESFRKKLTIKDNGNGFDVEELNRKKIKAGIGIENIKNLVKMLGGAVVIRSKLSEGTEIEIDIPEDLKGKVSG